jgi:hypothetical protein
MDSASKKVGSAMKRARDSISDEAVEIRTKVPSSASKRGRSDSSSSSSSSSSSLSSSAVADEVESRTPSKRLKTEHDENEEYYPTSFFSLLDGIKDFGSVLESGASMFSTAFSFFHENETAEREALAAAYARKKAKHNNNSSKNDNKDQRKVEEAIAIARQNDAMKLRLPSMWSSSASSSMREASERAKDAQLLAVKQNKVTSKENVRVKQGDVVNLGILGTKTTLTSFECANDHVLIVGNRRMIMTRAMSNSNLDSERGIAIIANADGEKLNVTSETKMAKVVWSQSLQEITSYSIRQQAIIEFVIHQKDTLTFTLPSVDECEKVLEVLRQKCPTFPKKETSLKSEKKVTIDAPSTPVTSASKGIASVMSAVKSIEKRKKPVMLTPGSYTKVDVCVRQLRYGVGEHSIHTKLISDGIDESYANDIINNAKLVLEGAILGLIPSKKGGRLAVNTAGTENNNNNNNNTEDVNDLENVTKVTEVVSDDQDLNENENPADADVSLPLSPKRAAVDAKLAARDTSAIRTAAPVVAQLASVIAARKLLSAESNTVSATTTATATTGSIDTKNSTTASLNAMLNKVQNLPKKEATPAKIPRVGINDALMASLANRMKPISVEAEVEVEVKVSKGEPVVKSKRPNPSALMSAIASRANTSSGETVPVEEKPVECSTKVGGAIMVSEHPVYAKYFKMLKVGLPHMAVKNKMIKEGVDPDVLDKNPSDMISEEKKTDVETVAISEHPVYAKYFKMMKMGLPLGAVQNKMVKDGIDPLLLDKDPSVQVPVDTDNGESCNKPLSPQPLKERAPRKKKFHWNTIAANKVAENSLWTEECTDTVTIDEDEFNSLFVEVICTPKKKTADVLKKDDVPAKKEKQVIYLIDMKRGQNLAISLARIKMSFSEMRDNLDQLNDNSFTADQLTNMMEYMPTTEEAKIVRNFKGDLSLLGQAEKYMLEMTKCKDAVKSISCLGFKHQFDYKLKEIQDSIEVFQNACNDVKNSQRLKKVLKTVLQVGKQMNGDDSNGSMGFTIDSLLKLSSAKAFDKKTSILQYIIMLLHRNDQDCLSFPDDLTCVAKASRLNIDNIRQESCVLKKSLQDTKTDFEAFCLASESNGENFNTLSTYFNLASEKMNTLENIIEVVTTKFTSVVSYFGDNSNNNGSADSFFITLNKFLMEFKTERDKYIIKKKSDDAKAAREKLAETRKEKIANQENCKNGVMSGN